jgi:NitT/TauT family transport system substrate-binding protein
MEYNYTKLSMTNDPALFRLNLGDPSESRVYYLPHFLAQEAGYFAAQGLSVRFQRTQGGGHTAMGGQIGPVVDGEADACVGGPMVTMKLREDGIAGIVNFCALVRANPWVIAGRDGPVAGLHALAGGRIIDAANVATANFCLRDALAAAGLAQYVTIEPGSGDLDADLGRTRADGRIHIHHSLHALGPALASGALRLALSMATVTPPVPWSAYIARSDRMAAAPDLFRRFRRAIEAALADVAGRPPSEIADCVAAHYPDYPRDALAMVIETYRDGGCFAPDGRIARTDMLAFATIMQRAGWLTAMPAIPELLDPEIAV